MCHIFLFCLAQDVSCFTQKAHCFRANDTCVNYSEGRLGRPSGEGHYCCLVLEYFKINNPYWFVSRPVMMSINHHWYQNQWFRFLINYSAQKRKASEAKVLQMFHFLHQSFNEIGRMMDRNKKQSSTTRRTVSPALHSGISLICLETTKEHQQVLQDHRKAFWNSF